MNGCTTAEGAVGVSMEAERTSEFKFVTHVKPSSRFLVRFSLATLTVVLLGFATSEPEDEPPGKKGAC